ncbi:MAG: LPS export ABC transporter ATP-binding protein [Candidatus Marinimicrobia bacterium]|nr:LPS export ABC transporter ATP-binding protein [Candidatus Neomarinimicrobiota bacterium]|tara:strand:- start:1458 stop:2180 length:723 start_codon:yes stop_codon:yes gene_type:complete
MKLSVEKISKSYSSKMAVSDISFEMDSGNTLGLLGPNGAGKTTLFYMIAGLLKRDSGLIELDTEDISDKDISERSKLGLSYLPQEASIFRKLTVKENILTSLQQRKDLNKDSINSELHSLLDEFNLNEFSDTLGIKLSGGERRRTEIARSLGSKPNFILLDEPFAGIDPIAVSELKKTIKQLKTKNIGILISDHNVRDTMQICDQVLIINQGKLISKGRPEEVSKDPLVKDVYLGKDFKQ